MAPATTTGIEVRPVLAHPRQVRPVAGQQAPGLLDDPVEDDLGLAQGGDARGDLAQGSLGLGAFGDGGLRPLELEDEVRVGDGDGRLVGQRAEDRRVHLVEGVPLAPVDLDGAERSFVADDRRDDEVADAGRPRQLVGRIEVGEFAGEVVARRDDPPLGHGPSGQALADAQPRRLDRFPLLVGQPGVVGGDDDAGSLVVLVDDRAVGAQQPEGLVDDALEQVAGLADRGDPGGDLAEGSFGLGPSLDDRTRAGELLDQACVPDGDRCLRGERGQDLAIGLVVGGDMPRHDRQRAERQSHRPPAAARRRRAARRSPSGSLSR